MKSILSGIALIGTAILAGRRRSGLSGLGLVNADHMDDVKRSLLKLNYLMAKASGDDWQYKDCQSRFALFDEAAEMLWRSITSYESVLGGDRESVEFLAKWSPEISDAAKRFGQLKQRFVSTCIDK